VDPLGDAASQVGEQVWAWVDEGLVHLWALLPADGAQDWDAAEVQGERIDAPSDLSGTLVALSTVPRSVPVVPWESVDTLLPGPDALASLTDGSSSGGHAMGEGSQAAAVLASMPTASTDGAVPSAQVRHAVVSAPQVVMAAVVDVTGGEVVAPLQEEAKSMVEQVTPLVAQPNAIGHACGDQPRHSDRTAMYRFHVCQWRQGCVQRVEQFQRQIDQSLEQCASMGGNARACEGYYQSMRHQYQLSYCEQGIGQPMAGR
jgi:hypothetical protein